MKITDFDYAIFDVDGTLLDSMAIWESVDADFLAEFGYELTEEFVEKVKSTRLVDAPKLFKSMYYIPLTEEEIYAKITTMGTEKYNKEVKLKPFVKELLEYLKSKNIKMCIATASLRSNVECSIHRLGIADYFEFLICADDLETGKDNPEIFNKCVEKFGLPIEQKDKCVIFEDACHAIKTATDAGFKVCAIFDGSAVDEMEKIKSLADLYIYAYNEIFE